jgi:magnesium transporter
VQKLLDDVADSYLDLLDSTYAEIDALEDGIDEQRPVEIRRRMSGLRHELLHRRRTVSATRAGVRRIMDGRVDVGNHELFPQDVERLFGDTYDTLVRVAEELDIARDLLGGVRDHLQSKISENQNEVGKKLTVIASLVLVPSLIVGYYGQNFESAFDETYWSIGVSTGLIFVSTLIQLAIFRWRRWI